MHSLLEYFKKFEGGFVTFQMHSLLEYFKKVEGEFVTFQMHSLLELRTPPFHNVGLSLQPSNNKFSAQTLQKKRMLRSERICKMFLQPMAYRVSRKGGYIEEKIPTAGR